MSKGFVLVDEPLIEYVIDQTDGREYRAGEYVFASARDIAQIRLRVFDAMRRGEPNIICAACHAPAYPRKHVDTGRFHFVHVSEDSDKDCPYNGKRRRLDTGRIDSMRYNGQKEGPDHKLVKRLLRSSIDVDPDFDHQLTREEKNWYGATDEEKWRRPDIAAVRKGTDGINLKIAFEIQLSSTYLKVIAARREFYLSENALLFWIFKDATDTDPRQYQDDLFYNNNSNLFMVDENSQCLSREQGRLIFRCCYYEPVLEGVNVKDVWRERFVRFDDLTIDIGNQRVYWYDYKGEKARLLETAGKVAWELEEHELRERYVDFWIKFHNGECKDPDGEYRQIRNKLSIHDILIPERLDREISRFTQMVLSAKAGEGVMTGYKTLLEVANHAYIHGKQFLWYFGRVLQHYGNWEKLLAQDSEAGRKKKCRGKDHESWTKKGMTIKRGIDCNSAEFKQDRSYDKLFFFLFPEISIPSANK